MNTDWWTDFLNACDEFVLSLIQQDLRHFERVNAFIDRWMDRAE
jgi:hypothetical protein